MFISIEKLKGGFRIDRWEVDPSRNQVNLTGQGKVISLEPRFMSVLVVLASHAPEVVSRDMLMEEVWGETIVSDDALSRCVSGIRKLLGDDRIIETVPKVGYALKIVPSFEAVPKPAGNEDVKSRFVFPILVTTILVIILAAISSGIDTRDTVRTPVPIPLGSQLGLESWPAWSPDGSELVFVHSEPNTRISELYLRRPGNAQSLQLTRLGGLVRSPDWDGSTNRIVFFYQSEESCSILSIPVLGGPTALEAECTDPYSGLDISPDGKWLLLTEKISSLGESRIEMRNREDGRKILIPNNNQKSSDYFPRFSPDGKLVLFVRSEGEGASDLFIYDREYRTVEKITSGLSSLAGADWTPDATSIIYSERSGLEFFIWSLDRDTGESRYLGTSGFHPRVNPKNGSIVVSYFQTDADLLTENGRVCSSSRTDREPVWRPGRSDFAFISERGGPPGIFGCDPSIDQVEPILEGSSVPDLISGLSAGPDGRLAFSGLAGKNSKIWILDSAIEEPRQLTKGSWNDLNPTWSSDGSWIYFGSDRTGSFDIWRIASGGGPAEQITTTGGIIARVRAQDETVYFTPREGTALFVQIPRDSTSKELMEGSGTGFVSRWRLLDGRIAFASPSNPGQILQRNDQTGIISVFSDINLNQSISGFSISEDESRWVVWYMARLESDLLLLQ